MVLDELAEGLARHVHAAEELMARRLPGRRTAGQDCDIGVAHCRQLDGGALGEAAPVVHQDNRCGGARNHLGDAKLEAGERQGGGVEEMAGGEGPLLAYVQKRELTRRLERRLQFGRAQLLGHGRMVVGGKCL